MLDRADKLVARASTIGKEAGKEAAEGAITGIITAPFKIIGKAGKGMVDLIGLGGRADFTADDQRLAADASRELVQAGVVGGKRDWANEKTGTRGSAKLLAVAERDGRPCVTMQYHVEFKSGTVHDRDVDLCQQPDGAWAAATQK